MVEVLVVVPVVESSPLRHFLDDVSDGAFLGLRLVEHLTVAIGPRRLGLALLLVEVADVCVELLIGILVEHRV